VLFGEQLPARQLAVYQAETRKGFDLVLSIGTTSIFPYISAPVLDAYHFRQPHDLVASVRQYGAANFQPHPRTSALDSIPLADRMVEGQPLLP
jgi:NAD-dependent deacetylase